MTGHTPWAEVRDLHFSYTPDPSEPTALAYSTLEQRWNLGEATGPEMTVALAVESARRWAARTDLSPERRVRAIYQVLATALEESE